MLVEVVYLITCPAVPPSGRDPVIVIPHATPTCAHTRTYTPTLVQRAPYTAAIEKGSVIVYREELNEE